MYWSQPTEIFARLFECWVTDKLAENDQQNGFWCTAQKSRQIVGI
ncbi:LPD1 domain-containing protein [Acinetobacter nosocomialis]|nr:LPD1 domain-containing protein [Acinetobacter nosocomialis]WJI02995.1 hypothetical protein MW889_18740 [Acinetobacter nosocomialis]WJI03000.1 hypothetical protein MW889_20000 [Acinetobacter nosocomialis]